MNYFGKPVWSNLKKKHAPEREGFIYLMRSGDLVKIGRTNSPKAREKAFKTGNPSVEVLLISWVKTQLNCEQYLHNKYAHKRLSGEWFKLSTSDVDEIKSLLSSRIEFPTEKVRSTTTSF